MMASVSIATAEFYYQLALLVRSGLPLPDSLRELGAGLSVPKLKHLVEEAGQATSNGVSLAEALGHHPDTFDPFLVRLIGIGEQTETLPVMLFTVAQIARFEQFLVASLRDILAYPLFTAHVAVLVAIGTSFFIIPTFSAILYEFMRWQQLPAFTSLVMSVGGFISEHRIPTIAVYAVFLAVSLWAFTPTPTAHRAMIRIVNVIPGTWRISTTLDAARMSQMLGNLLERHVPAPDALRFVSRMVAMPKLARALSLCADELDQGRPFKDTLMGVAEIDEMIRMTVEHCPEDQLPAELRSLAELYEHRVMLSVKSAAAVWTALAVLVATLIVFTVIQSMFLPLIQIIQNLSG